MSVIVIVIIVSPADDATSATAKSVDSREMLLGLPLRVHLLWRVQDRKVAHSEVVDSSVVCGIWAVHRELSVKGFPVHWAPPIWVSCIVRFVLFLLLLVCNQLVHVRWLICVMVMVVLLGQEACQGCLDSHGQIECHNGTGHVNDS